MSINLSFYILTSLAGIKFTRRHEHENSIKCVYKIFPKLELL